MRLARRLAGLIGGTAGTLGFLLCVAGLIGVWAGYVEVVRWVDRVFARADGALASIEGDLHQVTDRLRETERELEAVRKREAELASQPPPQRASKRAASRQAVEAMGPGVAEVRDILLKATEAALVANGLLEALAELPIVDRVTVDTDRLKEASTQLSELTDRTTRLTNLLARAAPVVDEEIGGESSRAVEAVRRPIEIVQAGTNWLEDGQQKIAAAHARLMRWINMLTAALTVVLVWIAAGQFSLMVHGWKWLRR